MSAQRKTIPGILFFWMVGFLLMSAFAVVTVHAAVPKTINYQGYLTDSTGTAVSGTPTMVFSIYSAPTGTVPVWTETQSSVSANNGIFSVTLGAVNPINISFDQQYYLGVQVGADPEMTPRSPISSVGSAITADNALTLSCSGCITAAMISPGTTLSPSAHTHATTDITGSLPDVQLTTNVALLDNTQTFSGTKSFATPPAFTYSLGAPFQVSTSSLVTNLNADYLDGYQASSFASASHYHYSLNNASGGSNALYINTSGNVGIGTTVPAQKLSVLGAIQSTSGGFVYPDGTTQTTAGRYGGLLKSTVLGINCRSISSVAASTWTKIADLGSFTKNDASSTIDIQYNGRPFVGSFSGATGANFELRVDDAVVSSGWARADLRTSEAGYDGRLASIRGIFTGLAAGTHTVNMWVISWYGTAGTTGLDSGCFSSDHVVINEYR